MLAGIGLDAVISFRVSRRAREIGIRMTLGARSAQVVWTVIGEMAVLIGVGTVAGLLVSLMTRAETAEQPRRGDRRHQRLFQILPVAA